VAVVDASAFGDMLGVVEEQKYLAGLKLFTAFRALLLLEMKIEQ